VFLGRAGGSVQPLITNESSASQRTRSRNRARELGALPHTSFLIYPIVLLSSPISGVPIVLAPISSLADIPDCTLTMASRLLPFVFGLAHAVSPAPQNRAAWLTAPATPFAVREAAYPSPLPHEIVIRSGAVAINPVDWKVQYGSTFPITYPHILGEDVAGEVVEVGSAVDSVKVGDRVVA
jgi:hypothetical protein